MVGHLTYVDISHCLFDEFPDTEVKHGRSRAVRTGGHEARLGVLVGAKITHFWWLEDLRVVDCF